MTATILPTVPLLSNGIHPTANGLPANQAVNDEFLYEVVDGNIVEVPRMGAFEADLASILQTNLNHFAIQNKMGRAEAEVLFHLDTTRKLKRRPDVAFVSYGRWPRKKRIPPGDAWDVIPNLAVEVVSPTNTAAEILAKVNEYFRAGCERVWVIYPSLEQVYVYQSLTQVRVLTRNDSLDGEEFLPGFQLPIASLFEADED